MAIVSGFAILIGWGLQNSGSDGADDELGGFLIKLVGVAGLVISVGFLAFTYSEYRSAVQALSSHDYIIASGIVKDFARNTPLGRFSSTTESFTVNGSHFEYGSGLSSAVFGLYWNTGFIRDGVDARITFSHEHHILRVEVR